MRDTTGPSNVQGGVIREVAEHQKHLQLGIAQRLYGFHKNVR